MQETAPGGCVLVVCRISNTFICFIVVIATGSGCKLPEEANGCDSKGKSGEKNPNCQKIEKIVLRDDQGQPLVSSRLAFNNTGGMEPATNSSGEFSVGSWTQDQLSRGSIQNVYAPPGETRAYMTEINNNSFGSLQDLNFGFRTFKERNKVVIEYPRIKHLECAIPAVCLAGPTVAAKRIAEPLMLPVTAQVCRAAMRINFSSFNGGGYSGPFQLFLSLRQDNGGNPGAVIAQKEIGNEIRPVPQATAFGKDSSGQHFHTNGVFANFCEGGSPISLNANQRYWIEYSISGVPDASDPRFEVTDCACPMTSGGLPLKKSTDGITWDAMTLVGGSQGTSLFLTE